MTEQTESWWEGDNPLVAIDNVLMLFLVAKGKTLDRDHRNDSIGKMFDFLHEMEEQCSLVYFERGGKFTILFPAMDYNHVCALLKKHGLETLDYSNRNVSRQEALSTDPHGEEKP